MVTLDQAFYGRDPVRGYRLFASSDSKHNIIVNRLCESIGTPDGVSDIEPFYVNYRENDYRYMISICIGNPDNAGRKTLFFHIFIGKHDALKRAGVGIGSLIQDRMFKTKYEPGPVLPISVEDTNSTLPWGKTSLVWNNEKLAIGSEKAELQILTGMLKSKIDEISWASFSFRPLNEFQIYVISKFVSSPQDRKCVSITGETLSRPLVKNDLEETQKEATMGKKSQKRFPPFLVFSILLNVVLAVGLFGAVSQNKNQQPSKPEDKNIAKSTQAPQIIYKEIPIKGATTRAEVIKELRAEFEKRYLRINGSWKKAMEDDPALRAQYQKYRKPPLTQAEGYIRFVHEFIFEEKEK